MKAQAVVCTSGVKFVLHDRPYLINKQTVLILAKKRGWKVQENEDNSVSLIAEFELDANLNADIVESIMEEQKKYS